MAPPPISAKLTLSYPLYAVDFDPNDSEKLVVGGGGGGGRSGVSNKITLLDATNATEISEVVEVDLSKDEDSVMSLAVGPTKGNKTLIYAGINSSEKDQAEGDNKHFRTFGLETAAATKKKTASTKISELSRAKLFVGNEAETYQRVLRLSKPFTNNQQMGVLATGASLKAKQPEIVIFDTTAAATAPPKVRGRAQLNIEAKDVDIIQTGKDEYSFAYCTEYEIFVKKISPKTEDSAPTCIYIIPGSQDSEKPSVPTFRCIRWIATDLFVILTNIWGRNGAAVQIMRLPPGPEMKCSIASSLRLPSHIKMATGLSVVNLAVPKFPGEPQGSGQFLIAVASTDICISLLACTFQKVGGVQLIGDLTLFQTLKEVHPLQITSIAFSGFKVPKAGVQPKELKLASVSMGNTVVVHTIKLSPYTKNGQTQYVATTPDTSGPPIGLALLIIFTLLIAFIVQTTLEIRGVSPNVIGIRDDHIQPNIVSVLKTSYLDPILGPARPVLSSYTNSDVSAAKFAASLLSLKSKSAGHDTAAPVVIIREELHPTSPELDGGIKADLHDEAVDGPHKGKTWDELSRPEKEKWKNKLKEGGQWAEDFGETVFKGVLFGAIGGAVGAAVGG